MSKFTNRGVFLPLKKEPAASRPIKDITPPPQVVVPLLSGDGSNSQPVVKVYDTVMHGDVLAQPRGQGGCPIYSPVTGIFNSMRNILHPLLGSVSCVVLDCLVSRGEKRKENSVEKLTGEEILELAFRMGIVDEVDGILLASKLAEGRRHKSIILVADASEQEPYCSAAWSVLNESAENIWSGLELAARTVMAKKHYIAVKLENKHLRKLKDRIPDDGLYQAKSKYPARVYPEKGGSAVCRIGVQACLALYYAAASKQPPCDCVVTVAGDAVANPCNVRVPFGTTAEDILHFCGLSEEPAHIILGDAMTGISIQSTDVPIISGITCLLALKSRPHPPIHTCIGCGRCVSACHADLLPYEIMRRLDNMQYERLSTLLPYECDGCGACSHVCPCGLDVTSKVLEAREAHGNIFMKWGDGDDL
ncbi:MAG: 4Fe-4S dicluster domain-containing protein [Oscillospiraceae bacterium]|nr:4Fe-4S dicluster domain-containing protein [Oscillospiraceae bacterium]MDD3833109.1 4Fe-4S dicluster domain-containing protein [Oscillospiraceae bacterium]MDD4545835.1 4Fe-4S dicluster domain-containing protein [Oscillospiraceae bacterium]